MINSAGYLQARVQARFAQLPDGMRWRELESARELTSYLAMARDCELAPWIKGLSPRSNSDEIEQHIVTRFGEQLEEAGNWLPKAWHYVLYDLSSLLPGFTEYTDLTESLRHWQDNLPGSRCWQTVQWHQLIELFEGHLELFSRLPVGEADQLRRALEHDLCLLFRRTINQPAALFIWLALVALLLERLRGDLLLRVLFTEEGGPYRGLS